MSLVRRPSVAVLLSSGERFGPYFGGALARWTYEVYRCLVEQFEVQVFGFATAPEDRYPLKHQTSRVAGVCQVMAHIPWVRRYEEEAWLRAIWGRLKRFDVIHIHNRPQWVHLLRKFGYQGAVVLHLQNNHLGHWEAAALDELATRLEGVAVCSAFLRDTFVPRSASLASKTRVVLNGVNTQLFLPKEEVREPKTVFFVGRFDPEKGVLQLVRAFARVLRAHPDAKLVIGGSTGFGTHSETAYVRQVRAEAANSQSEYPGSVRFAGYIHHDRDLPSWFQRATLFTSPSMFEEPFGLVNAEAMACATPVVGSNRGGIPEVLGDAGILINPEDEREYGDALIALFSDAERSAGLGRASLERVKEYFDWRVIARSWAAFLNQAIL